MFSLYWCVAFLALGSASKFPESPKIGIIGGHTIDIEQVPFMASLRLNGTIHWCGASIIHEQFVLTAAHCIVPNRQYKVLVGTAQVDGDGQIYEIEKIIPHESYSSTTQDFDICVIKLAQPLTFGKKVNKIELPDSSLQLKLNSQVDITGWGDTSPGGKIAQNLLQVKIPIISTRVCQLKYLPMLRYIYPRMMCAGGNGKDSCQGDSGGPLTLDTVQVGLASFGAGCGDLPGVYTKVAPLVSWINAKMEQSLMPKKHKAIKKSKKTKKNKKLLCNKH
ncbi:hypothetical protein ACJJTC_008327 [Scirpophaga incertulas]